MRSRGQHRVSVGIPSLLTCQLAPRCPCPSVGEAGRCAPNPTEMKGRVQEDPSTESLPAWKSVGAGGFSQSPCTQEPALDPYLCPRWLPPSWPRSAPYQVGFTFHLECVLPCSDAGQRGAPPAGRTLCSGPGLAPTRGGTWHRAQLPWEPQFTRQGGGSAGFVQTGLGLGSGLRAGGRHPRGPSGNRSRVEASPEAEPRGGAGAGATLPGRWGQGRGDPGCGTLGDRGLGLSDARTSHFSQPLPPRGPPYYLHKPH